MSKPSHSMRLVLDLDPQAEPIRGTVADPGGHTRAYVGRLALISALDELRGASTNEQPCPAPPSR
jgi:hypothetical protein